MCLAHTSPAHLSSPRFRRTLASPRLGENLLRLRRAEGVRSQCLVDTMFLLLTDARARGGLWQVRLLRTLHARAREQRVGVVGLDASTSCGRLLRWPLARRAPRRLRRGARFTGACAAIFANGRRLHSPRVLNVTGAIFAPAEGGARRRALLDFQGFRHFVASKPEKFSGLAGATVTDLKIERPLHVGYVR